MNFKDYDLPDYFAYKYYYECINRVAYLVTSQAALAGLSALTSTHPILGLNAYRPNLSGSYLAIQLEWVNHPERTSANYYVSIAIHDLITAILIGPKFMAVHMTGSDIPRYCMVAYRKSKFLGFLRKDWTQTLFKEMMDSEFSEVQKVMMLK